MTLKALLCAILLLGVASAYPSPDIVGGSDAEISEFPSIVIQYKDYHSIILLC